MAGGFFGWLQSLSGRQPDFGQVQIISPSSSLGRGDLARLSPEQALEGMTPENRLKLFINKSVLPQLFFSATELATTRRMRYLEYDMMEDNVIISSALRLLTEDAFQRDPDSGKSVWVDPDFQYADDLEALFEKVDLENRGNGWIRNSAKYGDCFLKPVLKSGEGIISIRDDLHPSDVWRVDIQGELLAFAYSERILGAGYSVGRQSLGGFTGDVRVVAPDQMVHFMFNYTPTYERYSLQLPTDFFDDVLQQPRTLRESNLMTEQKAMLEQRYRFLFHLCKAAKLERRYGLDPHTALLEALNGPAPEVPVEYDLTGGDLTHGRTGMLTLNVSGRYGTSSLFDVRKDYKILTLMEQALALGRLSRAALARIFFVNTTDATQEERDNMLRQLEDKLTKRQAFNASTSLYQSEYSPLNFLDDIFLPTTGGKGDTNVQTLGGDLNIKDIVDIDYYLSKLFSGLRIPKAYLGFEETLPGSLGAATPLIQLDSRYGHTVKLLQKSFVEGVKDICSIHLKYKNGVEIKPKDIPVLMTPISSAEELGRIESAKGRLEIIQAVAEFVGNNGGDAKKIAQDLFKDMVARVMPSIDTEHVFEISTTTEPVDVPTPDTKSLGIPSSPPPVPEGEISGKVGEEEAPLPPEEEAGEGEI